MKYKAGTLLSLSMNRHMFDINGKVHSCKSGELFLIIDDKDNYDTEYTIISMSGFYFNYFLDVIETTFQVIEQ